MVLFALATFGLDTSVGYPATAEAKLVPEGSLREIYARKEYHLGSSDYAAGFGFDSKTNDFKLVVIQCIEAATLSSTRTYAVQVYSLKSNSWRTLELRFSWEISVSGRKQ